jgi:hypothetical protein
VNPGRPITELCTPYSTWASRHPDTETANESLRAGRLLKSPLRRFGYFWPGQLACRLLPQTAMGSAPHRTLLAVAAVSLASCALPTQPSPVVEETAAATPTAFVVTSALQTLSGHIQAEQGIGWTVGTTADWIAPIVVSGTGPGQFSVQVESNLCGGPPRVAHLRVSPGRHYVPVQQGGADLGVCPSIDRTED